MSEFELISPDEVPAESGGHVIAFRDALEAALANPGAAVKVPSISQRQRNRLVQITSTTVASNKSKYRGVVKATSVRQSDGSYDVYLQAAVPAPSFHQANEHHGLVTGSTLQ